MLGALNKEIHLDFERRGWLLCDDVIRIKDTADARGWKNKMVLKNMACAIVYYLNVMSWKDIKIRHASGLVTDITM